MKKYVIEFIGTFFLILTIAFTHNPLAIGAVLTALVYTGGYISGANYNPAVTLALLMSKKLHAKVALKYMLTQFLASILAASIYFFIQNEKFVPQIATNVQILPAFLIETLFTFLLASVVLHTAATEKTKGNDYFGLAIGLTVMAAAFAGGPISGGAFNPAVGAGPILFDLTNLPPHLPSLLIYLTAPFLGGALASVIYKKY